jgi:hypothetical protein
MSFDPDLWPAPTSADDELYAFDEVQRMRVEAEATDWYTLRCIYGEKIYYVEHHRALAPGHCYSEAGVREAQRISSCCEFHFDAMFGEEE